MINLYSDPASGALHFFFPPKFSHWKTFLEVRTGSPGSKQAVVFFPPLGVIDYPLLFPSQADISSPPPLLVLRSSLLAGLKRPTGAPSLADDGPGRKEAAPRALRLPPFHRPVLALPPRGHVLIL